VSQAVVEPRKRSGSTHRVRSSCKLHCYASRWSISAGPNEAPCDNRPKPHANPSQTGVSGTIGSISNCVTTCGKSFAL